MVWGWIDGVRCEYGLKVGVGVNRVVDGVRGGKVKGGKVIVGCEGEYGVGEVVIEVLRVWGRFGVKDCF